jgi:hypothetical protein
MSEVDYVPFATGAGANVYTPATYQALSVVGTGVEPGLADPQLANTTWRLASMIAAAVANFISNVLGISVLDDGNLSNLTTNLTNAIGTGATSNLPTRTITTSTALTLLITDYAVGLNRTAAPAAMTVTLPVPGVGKTFRVDDLSDNFNAHPVTFALPGGHSFPGGGTTFVCQTNKAKVELYYYGSSLWNATITTL